METGFCKGINGIFTVLGDGVVLTEPPNSQMVGSPDIEMSSRGNFRIARDTGTIPRRVPLTVFG